MTKRHTKTAAITLILAILVAFAIVPGMAMAMDSENIRVETYTLQGGSLHETFVVEHWRENPNGDQLVRMESFNNWDVFQ
ncbi:MAG: hypothetical protein FWG88_05725 [Oscillospiraceae bacterium]|nr:hypothetical protein [Oscillospiraceae bacterium]